MNTSTVAAPAQSPTAPEPARFDLYAQMHKGLRAFMAATMVEWGRLDCDDDHALKSGLDQLAQLLDACSAHLDKENHYVHPAIEASGRGRSQRIDGEHRQHLAAITSLREAAECIVVSAPGARGPLCHALYRALAVFVAENLEHMEFEESQHNSWLWATYNDAQLAEIHAAIVAGTSPADMAVATRWVAPNLRPPELVALLGGVRQTVPHAVFQDITDLVRAYLPAQLWRRVVLALDPATPSDLPQDVARCFVQAMFVDFDGDRACALVGEDFVAPPWLRAGVPAGKDGVRQMAKALGGAFADVAVTVDEELVVGDHVVLRYTYGGRHVGDLFGVAATGRVFAIEGLAMLRVVAGSVRGYWREEDMLGLQRQLGVASLLADTGRK